MRRTLIACLLFFVTTISGAQQNHSLNLQDADIQALIATVSEITGKSFIVDPRVGDTKVTVISSKSMTPEEIYAVFESVLRVHGYAAVPAGDFTKIVPDAVGHQDTIPTRTNGGYNDDALVTQIVEVQHVPATELVTLLRPLIPQNGHIVAHSGSNVLVISDRAGNVDRLLKIIRRIDTAGGEDIEVIPLQHARATEVVRTLNMLNAETPQGGGAKVISDERTNSVLLSGDPGSRLRFKTLITHLDTPLESGATQVIYLRYADADSLVPLLQNVGKLAGGDGAADDSSVTIQAHADTNALVVSAPPAVFREIAGIVRQLDIRRQQVLVEAIIAEVSSDLSKELGVQWQATELNSLNDSGVIGGSNFPTNFGAGPGILGITPTEDGLVSLGGLAPGLNLGYLSGTVRIQTGTDGSGNPVFREVPQLGALVSALDADAGTNVLSTPSIVTLDHQEAIINVGQEVPFITGQFTNTGANNASVNPFQTIERRDVGLTLTVTPHINEGDTVVMDIAQEVSSLSPQGGAVDLITNTREVSTTVMVPDQGILVLGGLMDEDLKETVRKVPGLGDIPVVGNLFKFRSATKVKRNLMIFIRPRILRDRASTDAITGAKYNYMRAQQLDARDNYEGLMEREQLPILPDLDDYLNKDAEQGARDEP
ncbi:MAG: type II secretion system secretin GspD [Xanthomonadales bacterium]|nr:type II secretion system secretin GspD [Xanthomonadales bacterium]